MKLCQKCIDSIKEIAEGNLNSDPDTVPESECEFWTHQWVNKLKDAESP